MFSKELFSFYEGKKILVAGASGMSGHNLMDALQVMGAEVVGTSHLQEDELFYPLDFTDAFDTKELFDNNKFDYVFICCAKTYNAQVCKENPECLILPNIQMVSNILENCKRTGVKKVLYISSATVYQPSIYSLKENELNLNVNPHKIYMGIGWAKRYIEKFCEFYSELGLSTVIVRPTNIYGRYDKTDLDKCHVIPALIIKALNKESPYIINSKGDGIKNFIHVNDFVRDLCKAMMCTEDFNVFNLCSNETISILEVANIIVNTVGIKSDILIKDKPDYVSYLNISRSKFDEYFGEDTYTDIKTGIKGTIEWLSLSPQTLKKPITV